jgi:enoyl-CoA hydratase/carnithine racemase
MVNCRVRWGRGLEVPAIAVLLEKRPDGVAWVTLNRPRALNALDSVAKDELAAIWVEVAADRAVRAVLVHGAGSRAFCAGSDIKEMDAAGRTVSTDALLRAIPGGAAPLDKPIIAALHGYCIGMGLTLALHCDLRLAAPDTVLGFPETRHGMISGVSAMRLPQVIPTARALELLLLGQTITAAEAERIGLVNRVVADDVLAEAARWAQLAARNSPVATQATKHLALLPARRLIAAEIAAIDAARRQVEESADFREGARAFAERRPPAFEGL